MYLSVKIKNKMKELMELIAPKVSDEVVESVVEETIELAEDEIVDETPAPIVDETPAEDGLPIEELVGQLMDMVTKLNERLTALEGDVAIVEETVATEVATADAVVEELSIENEKLAKKNINFHSIVNKEKSVSEKYYDDIRKKLNYNK